MYNKWLGTVCFGRTDEINNMKMYTNAGAANDGNNNPRPLIVFAGGSKVSDIAPLRGEQLFETVMESFVMGVVSLCEALSRPSSRLR